MVSSDTIIDKQNSPVIKNRNTNADGAVLFSSCSKNDGYKKMNKEPQLEMAHYSGEFVPIAPPIQNRKNEAGEKHSAHVTQRNRIPPIAQQIKIQADLSRLNLKTREELVTKENKLLKTAAARDSFDVSVDLSPIVEGKIGSGFSTIRNLKKDLLPKMMLTTRNNKIDTKFLKQSELLRMKPDGFRRISIQTDVEFGGVTHAT